MNIQKLTVCHCLDRHGNPLLVLERLPANLWLLLSMIFSGGR